LSEKTISEKLLDFGFSQDEAKTYFSILRAGPCTASAVSRKLGFYRMRAYRILKFLEERGAVEVIVGRPVKFVAVPLTRITEKLLEEEKTKIFEMEKSRKEIEEYWRKAQTEVEALQEPRFRIIQRRKQVYEFLFEMIRGIKKEISIFTTRNDLQRLFFSGLDEQLRNLQPREFSKKILTQIDKEAIKVVESYMGNAEVRHVVMPANVRFVIVDGEVLSTFAMDDSMSMTTYEDTALWTDSEVYVKTMKTFFDSLWKMAPNAREVMDALKTGGPLEEIRAIGTEEEYYKTFRDMVDSSKSEIVIMNKYLKEELIKPQDLDALAGRGVDVKILTQVSKDEFQYINQLLKFADIMHNPTMSEMQMVIVDKREALVRFYESGYMTWSNIKPHVRAMFEVFESAWASAVSAKKILPKFAEQQVLEQGLRLAAKTLETLGWIVSMPGQIDERKDGDYYFNMVAKRPEAQSTPLVLDLLIEDDAVGQIVELKTKSSNAMKSLRLLVASRSFNEEEIRIASFYGIRLIHAKEPEELAPAIVNEASRVIKTLGLSEGA